MKVIPETYEEVLGATLKQKREELALTQVEVSAVVGVRQSTLSRMERGQSPVSLMQLRLLAALFKTSPGALLEPADRFREDNDRTLNGADE